jgi:hypothetical protein
VKHINMSKTWEFSAQPFPAYRASLVYGRNKRDAEFLAVKDVTPASFYTARPSHWEKKSQVLYHGLDSAAARKAKETYDAAERLAAEEYNATLPPESWNRRTGDQATIETGPLTLPENQFRVIKTAEKGTILVVPGRDDSNKCLLFVGIAGGFRGACGVKEEGTTGQILKTCAASAACESGTEVIALLDVGQTVALWSTGRRNNDVELYTWDGTQVSHKSFTGDEWKARNAVAAPEAEQYEVL